MKKFGNLPYAEIKSAAFRFPPIASARGTKGALRDYGLDALRGLGWAHLANTTVPMAYGEEASMPTTFLAALAGAYGNRRYLGRLGARFGPQGEAVGRAGANLASTLANLGYFQGALRALQKQNLGYSHFDPKSVEKHLRKRMAELATDPSTWEKAKRYAQKALRKADGSQLQPMQNLMQTAGNNVELQNQFRTPGT